MHLSVLGTKISIWGQKGVPARQVGSEYNGGRFEEVYRGGGSQVCW